MSRRPALSGNPSRDQAQRSRVTTRSRLLPNHHLLIAFMNTSSEEGCRGGCCSTTSATPSPLLASPDIETKDTDKESCGGSCCDGDGQSDGDQEEMANIELEKGCAASCCESEESDNELQVTTPDLDEDEDDDGEFIDGGVLFACV